MDSLKLICKLPFGKQIVSMIYRPKHCKPIHALGLVFPNMLGIAAGFDKNGKYIEELAALGFGFIEVGTVTPLSQSGNDQPRLFRLPEDVALINRMGFNNEGVDALVNQLKDLPKNRKYVIGGNIGKNKITPNEEAASDYEKCFDKLFDYVDYFVVNVSSPNTPGLRTLQEKEPLQALLKALQDKNNLKANPKPILLKIAPDLTTEQLDDIIEIVQNTKIAGLIATNTTIGRGKLITDPKEILAIGMGGLSGKPVAVQSNFVLKYIKTKAPDIFVIGVGGIIDPQSAQEKINLGADLIQVYSGFIYYGPKMAKDIVDG
jgi:dihydroorotate dehydrogenase